MAQGLSREEVKSILEDVDASNLIDKKTKRILRFAEKITRHAYKITESDIQALRDMGCSDDEIFESIAVAALLNYTVRMADALGVAMEHFQEKMAEKSG